MVAATLALAWAAGAASAQTYPLFRTVDAPMFTPQASFYNPVRDELVVIAYDGTNAQIYNAAGDLLRATAALPTPLGTEVDGAAYDGVTAVGVVVRHNCEVIELDPVTLAILSSRVLGGSGTIAAPTLCAGVDIGTGGTLFVADYFSARVLEYPRTGTTPVREFTTAVMGIDNLARAPGTDLLMIASNQGQFAIYRESGALVSGPSLLGTGIVLGAHTRTNMAGSDGLTFVGTSGRLWFCDHNDTVMSCYLQTRGCAAASDCPLPFIGCDVSTGLCQSAVCGDGRIQGGEECDDGGLVAGDGCSGGCVVEPGFVCTGEPSMCGTCMDDTAFGTDTGCTMTRPHCRTTGPRAPACEVCIDSSPDLGDLGCTPAAPFCLRNAMGVNVCVECNVDIDCDDRTECTTDICTANVCGHTSRPAGDVCSSGVCGGPGDDRCVECVTDAQCAPGFVCHPGRFCMPAGADAGPVPDAFFVLPDASIELPDAALVEPDAALPPLPDAAIPTVDAATPMRDAGRSDAGPGAPDAGMDAAASPDAGPIAGSFVGGAVCSASTSHSGSRAAWVSILVALGLVLARRRTNR